MEPPFITNIKYQLERTVSQAQAKKPAVLVILSVARKRSLLMQC